MALALGLLVPTVAAADDSDLQSELDRAGQDADRLDDELARQQAELSSAEEELAALGARLDDARGELQAAEGRLALAEEASQAAREEQEDAERAASDAAEALVDAERELQLEADRLADQAVAAYKFGSVGTRAGSVAIDVLRHANDPNELAVGIHSIGRVIGDQGVTVERVNELRQRRSQLYREAQTTERAAREAAAEAAEHVEVTDRLRAEAEELASTVAEEEARQEELTEALRADVAETEQSLARVASRQEELAAELAAQRAAREREAARQQQATRGGGGGGGAAGGPAIDGVCPVVGAVAGRDFSNDWGYPRSGGRTHQGNDIFAQRGTPIVAIADATVVRVNRTDSGLGGLTVTYRTDDGSEWYNAHLDQVAGDVAPGTRVAQGQQVGTVGNTGNARTTPPHNHIGRRIDGQWVNPWPTISPMCR